MQIVPINATPSQTLSISLANQSCTLNLYQRLSGFYMDVLVNDEPIIEGVICEDRNRIVRDLYLGFVGDFAFIDTQGTSDPQYMGLGARWLLAYLEASDLGGEG